MVRVRPAVRTPGGLTLVEMLVAMVILGFVMALLSQAVQQVTQLVRAADETSRRIGGAWSRGWTLQPLLANLVVPDEHRMEGFSGEAQRLSGYTTLPPTAAPLGVRPVRLELREAGPEPGSSQPLTEVWVSSPSSDLTDPSQTAASVIARLPCRCELAYVEDSGRVVDDWPISPPDPRGGDAALPMAIVLRDVDSKKLRQWIAFEGERLRPRPPSVSPFGP